LSAWLGYKRASMEGDGNSELVAMFTSRWPLHAPTSPKGQLRVALAGAAKTAAAAWPALAIPSEHFIGYLAERADPSLAPIEAVANLHLPDLYLACGVAAGDAAATDSFLGLYGVRLRTVIAAVTPTPAPAFVDQVMEELRAALLHSGAESGREGKIAQYRGRVPLSLWLERSAERRAATLQGRAKPFDDLTEIAALERARPPEPDHLRLRYPNGFGQQVTDGATAALGRMATNERALLRSHLVEGFGLRKLAHIRGVNVNTIARDLAVARDAIDTEIQAALIASSGLAPEDAAAVRAALFTRVNLGIHAALGGGRPTT
jgi:RNA polymerase sigma-70 factor (ECF subfamily)